MVDFDLFVHLFLIVVTVATTRGVMLGGWRKGFDHACGAAAVMIFVAIAGEQLELFYN